MASRLTRFIVIESVSNNGHHAVRETTNPNAVIMRNESVFSTLIKIEAERATSNNAYIHLRFCNTNRYWQRNSSSDAIVAQSNKPSEDMSDRSCTLFEATVTGPDTFFLTHIQTGWRVVILSNTTAFHLSPPSSVSANDGLLRFVNWDSLVHLPTHVAFQGSNDDFLKGIWAENAQFLQFASSDPNELISNHRVQLMPDGHVRIYSDYFTRWWRFHNDWIWASTMDPSIDDRNLLFWPIKVDNNTIALRSVGNNRICQLHSWGNINRCLNAAVTTITNEARIRVHELVLNRSIYNVRYRMEDARIYGETPYVAGTTTAANFSNEQGEVAVQITYQDSSSYTFSRSLSLTAGVTTTISAGVPLIAGATIEIGYQVNTTFEWGESRSRTTSVTATGTIPVPARSVASVRYVATMGTCDVPYSYTQQERSSTTGQITELDYDDGLFTGVSCYNFNFVVEKTTPLNHPSLNFALPN
ncbi:hypothetical protein SASPL_113807 [Salvia splendens]|uniref:Agglutinin domain-containing protein n=1 Tax=Salvia splendens TaxID=180675 RepID=A0A8X8Y3H3_SALSN|nr:uncharacterized protein LOC121804447 [Salvia splendens]KAG6423412.1 hypothetical protein SASPL_113807 [Salvia splendens]